MTVKCWAALGTCKHMVTMLWFCQKKHVQQILAIYTIKSCCVLWVLTNYCMFIVSFCYLLNTVSYDCYFNIISYIIRTKSFRTKGIKMKLVTLPCYIKWYYIRVNQRHIRMLFNCDPASTGTTSVEKLDW